MASTCPQRWPACRPSQSTSRLSSRIRSGEAPARTTPRGPLTISLRVNVHVTQYRCVIGQERVDEAVTNYMMLDCLHRGRSPGISLRCLHRGAPRVAALSVTTLPAPIRPACAQQSLKTRRVTALTGCQSESITPRAVLYGLFGAAAVTSISNSRRPT